MADDLTGGMFVASRLEAIGVCCPLVTRVEALAYLPSDIEAVVRFDPATPLLPSGPIAVATSADQEGVAAAQARFGRDGA